jgi:FixJ family two-component response regulator
VVTIWNSIRSFFARSSGDIRPGGPLISGSPVRYATAPSVTIVALVVEDQDRKLVADIGHRHQWDVHFANTCEDALEASNELVVPVILCDRDLPGTEWRDVVRSLASCPHRACVILISRVLDDYLWDEVGRRGGYDVLSKPLQEVDVVRAVRLASSYWNTLRSVRCS